jgi:hypothetical protein
MQTRKNVDTNEFEGRVKITGFPSKEAVLEKINGYIEKYKSDEKEKLYEIEKETSSSILLNFHKNTEMANLVIGKLKLLQMGNQNFSKLNCHLSIKVISPNQNEKNEKKEENEKKEDKKEKSPDKKSQEKNKNRRNEVYNIDTKNNPRLNKLLSKSLNFNRKNMNKYMNPDSNKMKIYESIFLNGGPYVDKFDYVKDDARKNKAQWLNKKGFIPYISKETILKNAHMIDNILYKEPANYNPFKFRPVQKSKWVGKNDFYD